MYILNAIPLIKIPRPNSQILSYFSNFKIKPGFLIKVPLRNKKINAIVLECNTVEQERLRLKKYADFEIKPIEKLKNPKQILNKKQIELLIWLSEYYFAPIGQFARIFLSKNLPTHKNNSLILTPKTKRLVFSPFKKLKSIIVEDADNDLYESWGKKPYYNAKNIAIQLTQIHNAKLILKTNLPSIETYYWAKQKKYKLEIQDTKHKIQNTNIIDMRKEMVGGNFSPISKKLEEKITNSNKTILFIARRGTSTIVLCRECGYIAKCPSCDIPMVFHKDKPSRRLVCHHCGKDDIAPVLCPNCKSIKIKYLGSGTQKIEEKIKNNWPNKRVLRMDSDISEKPIDQQKIIQEFNNSQDAILIGSQMVLNKGLKADLTAVVSIDTVLNLPDFKTSERIFEIIGRIMNMSNKEFLIQTYNPDNKIFNLAIENNFNTFYNEEIKDREKFDYPPFSEIIKLSYFHKNFLKAKNEAKILFEKIKTQVANYKISNIDFKMLGPTSAFIAKEKGLYKWNIIIKSKLTIRQRNKILIIIPSIWEVEVI